MRQKGGLNEEHIAWEDPQTKPRHCRCSLFTISRFALLKQRLEQSLLTVNHVSLYLYPKIAGILTFRRSLLNTLLVKIISLDLSSHVLSYLLFYTFFLLIVNGVFKSFRVAFANDHSYYF